MSNPLSLWPIIQPILVKTDVAYAVGGGVAMMVHGYTRTTQDLDVFVSHTDGPTVLAALRKAKVRFATLADPYHYAVIPSARNPDHRIDLLFTSDDIEIAAVNWSMTVKLPGIRGTMEVVPLDILVAMKTRSDRGKDHDDVRRMYERGMVNKAAVVNILRSYGEDPSALTTVLEGAR